jgi:hypothetical protein
MMKLPTSIKSSEGGNKPQQNKHWYGYRCRTALKVDSPVGTSSESRNCAEKSIGTALCTKSEIGNMAHGLRLAGPLQQLRGYIHRVMPTVGTYHKVVSRENWCGDIGYRSHANKHTSSLITDKNSVAKKR